MSRLKLGFPLDSPTFLCVHRSVRGNYLRTPCNFRVDKCFVYFCVFVIFCVLAVPTSANIMGERCDWSGNGLSVSSSQSRGVTPVYLRCSQGNVTWTFPRGALRVLLRLPSAEKDFRGCLKVSKDFSGARIFLEGTRSLAPLFAMDDGGHKQLLRCFQSRKGQAALYVEAENPSGVFKREIAEFSYDLQPVPKGASLLDLIDEDCRPCSRQEMAHAFCTSDIVSRGTIHSVDNLLDLEQARINVRLGRTLRHSTDDSVISIIETNEVDSDDHGLVRFHMPSHCDPQHGPGEFVFMGRKRLGDLTLSCVASLSEWTKVVRTMNTDGTAHCMLRS